jgi:hypothetical protein
MEVDVERYKSVMAANSGRSWQLELDADSVSILHGALRLMMLHPKVKEGFSPMFKSMSQHLRNWCLVRFREMGFTEEEVKSLDSEFD